MAPTYHSLLPLTTYNSILDTQSLLLTTYCSPGNAKPFEKPVAKADAPDYYEIIKDPLDLATIGQRLRRGYYATPTTHH